MQNSCKKNLKVNKKKKQMENTLWLIFKGYRPEARGYAPEGNARGE